MSRLIAILLLSISLFLSWSVGAYAGGHDTIRVLTLDDRPPNNLFLKQLGAIAGINLIVEFGPDPEPVADCISLNAAVAGSLVGSRSIDPYYLDPAFVPPDALLHFAVPRIEPTVSEGGLAEEYQAVRTVLQDEEIQQLVLDSILNPEISLDDEYLAAYADRMRGWIDFLDRAAYDPDRLLITLDDNRPGPLAEGLKEILRGYSHYVQDGTDEGMMLLLARALRERQELPETVCGVIWPSDSSPSTVQPFESGLVFENIYNMVRWLGVQSTIDIEALESWQPVIWINAGVGPGLLNNMVWDRPVIVADINLPNGGDPELFRVWADNGAPDLRGYVGWNTSSNTLGSAFALWTAIDYGYEKTSAPEGVRAAIETFLWARILDDYLYQRLARPDVTEMVREMGEDSYNIREQAKEEIEKLVVDALMELWREIDEPLDIDFLYVDPDGHTRIFVRLPWNRMFEIELYPIDDRAVLPAIQPWYE